MTLSILNASCISETNDLGADKHTKLDRVDLESLAISDSMAPSFSATKAIFALNTVEYRFRFRVLISSLLVSVESSPFPTVRKMRLLL